MIKEIFVPLLHYDADVGALNAAAVLSKAHGAHVAALVTLEHPLPLVTEFGYVPVELTQLQIDQARKDAQAQVESARAQLARRGAPCDVRLTDVARLWSEETAAVQARYADISVIGGPDPIADTRFILTFNSLLMRSGRPVMVIPSGSVLKFPLQRVVLAWQPTREATRALHDALPMLTGATEVDVLMVDPDAVEGQHGQRPGSDIAAHLARHGLIVNVVTVSREGRSDGRSLLQHVQKVDADLLIMGGYGHARWREVILGGATRTVLEGMNKPVMFSH